MVRLAVYGGGFFEKFSKKILWRGVDDPLPRGCVNDSVQGWCGRFGTLVAFFTRRGSSVCRLRGRQVVSTWRHTHVASLVVFVSCAAFGFAGPGARAASIGRSRDAG